jgi:hypothetical protein
MSNIFYIGFAFLDGWFAARLSLGGIRGEFAARRKGN